MRMEVVDAYGKCSSTVYPEAVCSDATHGLTHLWSSCRACIYGLDELDISMWCLGIRGTPKLFCPLARGAHSKKQGIVLNHCAYNRELILDDCSAACPSPLLPTGTCNQHQPSHVSWYESCRRVVTLPVFVPLRGNIGLNKL